MISTARLRPGIAAKAVFLILLLAGMSVLANWFCLRSVDRLDTVNKTLAQSVSPARLALAEAKAAVTAMGLATYKTIAAADPESVRAAAGEIRNQYEVAVVSLDNVVAYFPSQVETVAAIRTRLDRVYGLASRAREAVLNGRPEAARTTIDLLFEAALDDTAFQTNRLINILGAEVKTVVAQAETEQAWAFWAAVIVLAGGTLVTVLLAAGATHLWVSRPLQRLAAHAVRVREADLVTLPQDDPMLRRTDEIGTLATSFNRTIAELDATRAELAAHYQRLDAAINNMPQGICMFDRDRRLIVCNRRYVELYGLDPSCVRPGTLLGSILQKRISGGSAETAAYVEQQLTAVAESQPLYLIQELDDGRVISISHQPMLDGGWIALHEDVTERRRAEAKIAYLAHHDALTGLPNRVTFRQEIERGLARVDRGESLAVLCVDLDRFKTVNDTLGHPIGDQLLQAVAERLRQCLRTTDTVARFGGDEFVVLQVAADQPVGGTVLATRLIQELSAPFEVAGHHVVVGASVGIAVAPADGRDPDVLMKNADMALYRAKEDGRGIHRFFEPAMDARMQSRRTLELDLRKALAMGEFEVFYQPLMNLKSEKVSGFEALLRWRHPVHGLVPPADFIPLAEEIGLITPIGAWVLRQACADAARWPKPYNIAVNLSPRQFAAGTVALDVISALGASGLAPQRLELEITETVLLQDTDATIATLNELRDLGVRISMDDFGTGYSSLGYLRRFPFDKIKIDRSFIHDLAEQSDSIAIVRAIAGLGSALGITTTAEGVETPFQLQQLRDEGCTEVQGYLLSEPKPASELGPLMSMCGRRLQAS
ncbi:diguanylate cyclase [Rhodovulum sp. PH10]|uniref:EAL domain-containing protein n=1 Tax=Rhodovulum sp. PH10 TaxID=1187851 RepID=UPI00027C25C9|nr:EAL domain-containing protein [Rhodovulum sp. PH10]EJW13398.1 diguanylate cyclase [Rhodovulum sp. PH10]